MKTEYPIYLISRYGVQIKIVNENKVVTVNPLEEITTYNHASIFLEDEHYTPSTDDAFNKAFDSTILELKTLTQ